MPFEARALPTMIELGGEMVAGPFCRHCGYPLSLHSDNLLCRTQPNAVLGPCCDCHEIRRVTVTDLVPDPAYVGRKRRKRVTHEALRIVRKDAA